MIVSASRRTDIPAFYAEWFRNRIRAGFVLTRNPMNHAQLSRIPLTPDVVDCIVFWTKDPAPLTPYLDELDRRGYPYYFQFTLTPYGREAEPGLRDKREIVRTFQALSERVGRRRVVWRYDPILLSGPYSAAYHRERFARLCGALAPYTDTVTISFVDVYPKLKTPLVRAAGADEIAAMADFLGKTAREHGLRAVACCESADLTPYGIGRAACIDRDRVADLCGGLLPVPADKNQRPGCGCCESVDIGAYNTCPNGCVYCYANDGAASARRRHEAHDPDSPLLFGRVAEGETITERKVRSYRTGQLGLHT